MGKLSHECPYSVVFFKPYILVWKLENKLSLHKVSIISGILNSPFGCILNHLYGTYSNSLEFTALLIPFFSNKTLKSEKKREVFFPNDLNSFIV